ncbi:23S rRNA (guanosine(2251)-2'-O)-methyltransferase RlmB [Marmoricola endophyticus]|uniref:23S rRNA (Guanosine(2251)-2'-O)-methyltransferase RlmB n=1 Tax=Marmoricola endophyticus TaxID=2040280 RepID=A0A917BRC0_9ACTN|nr:TrmH family RNA methyltransferase [Marmoricola endophyticus]GGF53876.1 23S rRNA (guanosine(2251)-2'-O)-methyltransferase RlmB [Marmoricola endophyticus]
MSDADVLTDLSDPAVQRIADIVKKSRANVRTAIVEDPEPLLEALSAGVEFLEVYADASREVPADLAAACATREVTVRRVDLGVLNKVFKSEKRPRQFGLIRAPRAVGLAEVGGVTGDLVILDGVKIVGNIGAIIRTAYALGAGAVVLVDSDLTSVVDRRLVRASRGFVFSLPVVLASREEVRRQVESDAWSLVDVDMGGTLGTDDLRGLPRRLGLVLGAEKSGVGESLHDLCEGTVGIPINPAADSLNVSVAAGIVLHARYSRTVS